MGLEQDRGRVGLGAGPGEVWFTSLWTETGWEMGGPPPAPAEGETQLRGSVSLVWPSHQLGHELRFHFKKLARFNSWQA